MLCKTLCTHPARRRAETMFNHVVRLCCKDACTLPRTPILLQICVEFDIRQYSVDRLRVHRISLPSDRLPRHAAACAAAMRHFTRPGDFAAAAGRDLCDDCGTGAQLWRDEVRIWFIFLVDAAGFLRVERVAPAHRAADSGLLETVALLNGLQ